MDKIIISLISATAGFVFGVLTAFLKGWFDEYFKKREELRTDIKNFMGKVVDVVAIATPASYKIRLNEVDKRRLQRCAFQLERLGEFKMANDIRSYLNKWQEVYNISSGLTFKNALLTTKDEEERRLNLINDLDNLTGSILKK